MLSPIHDNLDFYLKEMEMEHQWELKQNSEESGQAASEPAEPAHAIHPNRDLYLPHQVEQVSKTELTADQHARLRDKAEALYGAVADMEQAADDHELNRRA